MQSNLPFDLLEAFSCQAENNYLQALVMIAEEGILSNIRFYVFIFQTREDGCSRSV